jgi:hypothetical protein
VLAVEDDCGVLYGSEDLRIEMIDVPALAAESSCARPRRLPGTDLKVWSAVMPR